MKKSTGTAVSLSLKQLTGFDIRRNRLSSKSPRHVPLLVLLFCAMAAAPLTCSGQVTLTNGWPNAGLITTASETNTWTLSANMGDRINLQLAKTSGGAGFTPRLEAFSPDGASLGFISAGVAARLNLQAPVTGTYTISIRDALLTGTGEYQIWLAQIPGPFVPPPGATDGVLTNGANQQGEIALGDLDIWQLTATRGDRITIQIGELSGGSGFTPMIEVFGPDGTRLGMDSGAMAARLNVQADLTGIYTVLVSDASTTGAGTYELHLAHVPDAVTVPEGDEGGPLTTLVDHEGTITAGDLDLWTFDANSGERILLDISELTGGPSFTPLIEVYGPSGELKGFAQHASAARIDTAAESSGSYTVIVGDATKSGSGTYQLTLTRDAIGSGANILTNGSMHVGEISGSERTNLWRFTASAGDSVVVRAGEISQTGNFSVRLRLFNSNLQQLDTANGALGAEVSIRATNSGNFVVAVDATSIATSGSYRLSLAKTGSDISISANDEGGTLTNGLAQLGTIDIGDLDTWAFTANAGENIIVRAGEITASLTPQLRLYGPGGALLDFISGGVAAEVSTRATNSGVFVVTVGDLTAGYAGSGNYRLTLVKTGGPLAVSPGDEGGTLTNGATYLASIDVGDLDAWSFIANAQESVILRIGEGSASLTPELRIYDPAGALLDNGFGTVAGEVAVRATNSGRFMVVADDRTAGFVGSGNYRLTMAKTGGAVEISANDEGGTLTNGATYIGSVEVGDIDAWTVKAMAGETMVIRMGQISGTLRPQLRLYDPNGASIDSGVAATAAEVTARATNSGTFLVVAGDLTSGWAGAGNYRLSLAKTGASLDISANDEGGIIVNGTTYLGSIDVGDIDAWLINANPDEAIVARMGETTAASTLTPQLRLYNQSGALVSSGSSAVAFEVSAESTNSGPFLLVASDLTSGWAGTGNYRLTVAKTGNPLTISGGNEGGSMIGVDSYEGSIEPGDMDAWTFTSRAGEVISINLTELVTGSSLTPQLRLYGRDGTLLRSFSGAATAQFSSYVLPEHGTYMLVVSDLTAGYAGSGTYRVTVGGLTDGLKLYPPIVEGTQIRLLGVGGTRGDPFTVLTTAELSVPLAEWEEVPYEFDQFGVMDVLTQYEASEPHRFFLLRVP